MDEGGFGFFSFLGMLLMTGLLINACNNEGIRPSEMEVAQKACNSITSEVEALYLDLDVLCTNQIFIEYDYMKGYKVGVKNGKKDI